METKLNGDQEDFVISTWKVLKYSLEHSYKQVLVILTMAYYKMETRLKIGNVSNFISFYF